MVHVGPSVENLSSVFVPHVWACEHIAANRSDTGTLELEVDSSMWPGLVRIVQTNTTRTREGWDVDLFIMCQVAQCVEDTGSLTL